MFTCKTSAVKQNSADPSVYVRLLDTVHSVPLGNMWVFHLLWKIIFTPNKIVVLSILLKPPFIWKLFRERKQFIKYIHKLFYKCFNVFVSSSSALPVYTAILINAAF